MRFLKFINLIDSAGRLDWTVIILIVISVKISLEPTRLDDVIMLALALACHGYARFILHKETVARIELDVDTLPSRDEINKVIARVEELGGKVSNLNLAMGLTKNR